MQLQLALDCNLNIEKAETIINQTKRFVDIVEIGTPFILEQGSGVIRHLKSIFPEVRFLADIKLIDAGAYETNTVCEAGAEIATVLAAADDCTIQYALAEARKHDAAILADMIAVKDITKRAGELERLSVDYICLHTADDMITAKRQNNLLYDQYKEIRRIVKKAKLVITGGITLENMEQYKEIGPDVIIVGADICKAEDPEEQAAKIRRKMEAWHD